MPALITNGTGDSYGFEVLLKKNAGDFRGTVSYTLSKTTRQFDQINGGKQFLYDFDRTHSGSFSLNYQLSKIITFSVAWYIQSGLPYTPVIGRQYTTNPVNSPYGNEYYDALIYGPRNSARMKTYHRLDIGATLKKKNKWGNNIMWTFSVYNAYNRRNPVYYYYNSNSSNEMYYPEFHKNYEKLNLYQISLFPIIPTISYTRFFDGNGTKKSLKERLRNWFYFKYD